MKKKTNQIEDCIKTVSDLLKDKVVNSIQSEEVSALSLSLNCLLILNEFYTKNQSEEWLAIRFNRIKKEYGIINSELQIPIELKPVIDAFKSYNPFTYKPNLDEIQAADDLLKLSDTIDEVRKCIKWFYTVSEDECEFIFSHPPHTLKKLLDWYWNYEKANAIDERFEKEKNKVIKELKKQVHG